MFRPVRAVIVGGALLATLGLAACTTSGTVATTPDPKPPATTTAPKPTPAPEPTDTEQLAAWWAETSTDVDSFIHHNDQAAGLFAHPDAIIADSTAAELLLSNLKVDVAALKSHGPIPIPTVNRPWQQAMDAYTTGYALALDGVETMNPDTMNAGAAAIILGNGHMDDVTAALQAELDTAV